MRFGIALLMGWLGTGLAAAQHREAKSETRIVVEDGEDMTVTGCVRRANEGHFTLTHAAGKDGAVGSYILAETDDEDDVEDLDDHVGHRVEIKGKAVDKGKGRIKVYTKSEIRKADGETAETESRSEIKGDLAGLPYLGVEEFRMIASVCP